MPSTPNYKNPTLPVGLRVRDLLIRMTIEEKVAQLISLVGKNQLLIDENGALSEQNARSLLAKGIGGIYSPSQNRTPHQAAAFTNTVQQFLIEKTRLGVPALFSEEGLHGLMAPGSAHYPQAIALASTWDPELVEETFSAVAVEMRARGVTHALAPVLDLARDPRLGKTEETYGEDPFLVARMGIACIKGLQGNGPEIDESHVIATARYLGASGQPEGGTNGAPTSYSERELREQFLRPFEAAVREAHVLSIMPSYNEIDGIPSHTNSWLLQDILREEMGFDGLVISGLNGISELRTVHRVVADFEQAARLALKASVDMEHADVSCYTTLVNQVQHGLILESLLDRAVGRILTAKFLLGLFDNPYVDPDAADLVANCEAHRKLAHITAQRSIVLLKNEGAVLPLDKKRLKSIAVIGPNAADIHLGGYSDNPGYTVSILEGIKNKAGPGIKVIYSEGCKITKGHTDWRKEEVEKANSNENARSIADAIIKSLDSNLIIMVLGENEEICRESSSSTHLGDRDSLDLLGEQENLARAIFELGKPTIVVLINGRPLSINYINEHVQAIIECWYLGQETGNAVADVIFGAINPGGKLPITFPRSVGQIPAFYNHKPSAKRGYLFSSKEPLFPFGHGLSYTTFKYENLQVTPGCIGPEEQATVSVSVTNTGKLAGDEVVQLYIRDIISSVTRPVKELKGFLRITLEPGESRRVQFTITPEMLSFYDRRMHRTVEPGHFEIMVGTSSATLTSKTLEVR